MADTAPTAGLRFEITGDNADLKAKFAEIDKLQAKTAEGMASAYDGAASKVGDLFGKLRDAASAIDKGITSAMDGGAAGVEKAVVGAMEGAETAVKKGLDNLAQMALSKMGIVGKGLSLIWPLVSKEAGAALDGLKTKVAEKLSEALNSDTGKALAEMAAKSAADSVTRIENVKKAASEAWKNSTGLVDGVVGAVTSAVTAVVAPATEEVEKLSDAAQKAKDRMGGLFEGAKNGVEVLLGIRMATEEYKKLLVPLDAMIAKQKQANELIGKSAGQRAKILAKREVDAVEVKGQKSDDQEAELDKKIDDVGKEAQRGADMQAGIRQEEQARRILATVKEQAELEAARSKEMGKTAGEMARMQAEARANLSLTKAGIVLDEAKKKLMQEQLDLIEKNAQARAAAAVNRQVAEGGQSALSQIKLQTEALGLSSGAQAEASFTAKAYADSIKAVGTVTDEVVASTRKWAPAIREATDAQDALKRSFQQVQDAGNVVAKGLENAFAKWTTGAKISVKEMVSSMIADMAQLAFKNSVSQLLFGQSGSVNNGGGLFGSLATTMFGKRENGGPAPAGVPLIVGEKRPELFVPKTAGYVLPQVPTGGSGQAISMPISIDMRGATVDAVQKLRAELPGLMMRYTIEAQQRGARI